MLERTKIEISLTEQMQPRICELQAQGITTICVDIDGTLIYGSSADVFFDKRKAALTELVAREKKIDLTEASILVQEQRQLGKRGSDALGSLGIRTEKWYDTLCEIDPSCLEEAKEAKEILTALKASGMRLIAITDEPLDQSERVLRASGIDPEIFDKRIGWQKGQSRPKDLGTSVFSELTTELICDPEEMLMIGDRVEQDIKPALRVGYNVALINNDQTSSSPSLVDFFTQTTDELQANYLADWENELSETKAKVFDIKMLPEYITSGRIESLRLGDSYIVTLDTNRLIERLFARNGLSYSSEIQDAIQTFNSSLVQIMRQTLEETPLSLVVISEEPFYEALDTMIEQASSSSSTQLVNIDRFIDPENRFKNVAVISAGRYKGSTDESISERPGEIPLDDQMTALENRLIQKRRNQRNDISLIDDGFSTREDFATYREIFAKRGINLTGAILGIGPYGNTEWNAIGGAQASGCNDISVVVPAYNPSEWICGRDFTLFGGKMWRKIDNEVTSTAPYFAPFTDGSSASIPADKLFSYSMQLLQANLTLVQTLEANIGRNLSFQDAISAGYGVPIITTDQFDTNAPQSQDSIREYIQTMINLLKEKEA